jgi:hypothetical protein
LRNTRTGAGAEDGKAHGGREGKVLEESVYYRLLSVLKGNLSLEKLKVT